MEKKNSDRVTSSSSQQMTCKHTLNQTKELRSSVHDGEFQHTEQQEQKKPRRDLWTKKGEGNDAYGCLARLKRVRGEQQHATSARPSERPTPSVAIMNTKVTFQKT